MVRSELNDPLAPLLTFEHTFDLDTGKRTPPQVSRYCSVAPIFDFTFSVDDHANGDILGVHIT